MATYKGTLKALGIKSILYKNRKGFFERVYKYKGKYYNSKEDAITKALKGRKK